MVPLYLQHRHCRDKYQKYLTTATVVVVEVAVMVAAFGDEEIGTTATKRMSSNGIDVSDIYHIFLNRPVAQRWPSRTNLDIQECGSRNDIDLTFSLTDWHNLCPAERHFVIQNVVAMAMAI